MMPSSKTSAPRVAQNLDLAALVKESGFAAILAAFLALPIVGLGTREAGAGMGLTLDFRFDWVLIGAGGVFIGRLLLGFLRSALGGTAQAKPATTSTNDRLVQFQRYAGIGLFAFAILLPFTPFADRYIIDIGIKILIYVMLGWGLNIVVGLAGLLDLGYVAFYAVGAYTYALLALNFGFGFWEALPLAGLFAAAFGVILGFPVLRLRGDYLAIVTLGFGEIIRVVLINWVEFTGGPNGITSIPRLSFFGFPFAQASPDGMTSFHQLLGITFDTMHRQIFLFYVILALAMMTNLFTMRIRKLPVGRAWEAIREDEIACRAIGINPTNTKLTAFGIGAMFAGFAGAFFATNQAFISPESFTFHESALILAIVVLGGMGSQLGIVLAASVLVLLTEFRQISEFRMLFFGLAMVAIMLWRPRGLLAYRLPSIRLPDMPQAQASSSALKGAAE